MSEIVDKISQLFAAMEANDPLLSRGILRDWVAVINPAFERPLRDYYKAESEKAGLIQPSYATIDSITMRKTYIMNHASIMGIEYMDEATFREKYAEELKLVEKIFQHRLEEAIFGGETLPESENKD